MYISICSCLISYTAFLAYNSSLKLIKYKESQIYPTQDFNIKNVLNLIKCIKIYTSVIVEQKNYCPSIFQKEKIKKAPNLRLSRIL